MNWSLAAFLALAVVLTVAVGPLVKYVLDEVTRRYQRPDSINAEKWTTLVQNVNRTLGSGAHSGALLGNLERLVFVISIWQDAIVLIPSWLAVKVATKWNAWSRILSKFEVTEDLQHARIDVIRYVQWRLSQRFLLGNLVNVLLAFAIYGASYVIAYKAI